MRLELWRNCGTNMVSRKSRRFSFGWFRNRVRMAQKGRKSDEQKAFVILGCLSEGTARFVAGPSGIDFDDRGSVCRDAAFVARDGWLDDESYGEGGDARIRRDYYWSRSGY